MKTYGIYIVLGLLSIMSISCSPKKTNNTEFIEISGYIKGTYYRVVAQNQDNIDLESKITQSFKEFDSIFNNYNPQSTISKINRNEPATMCNSFFYFMQKSELFHILTEGAFDITVAPLANAWKFGFDNDTTPPSTQKIQELLAITGMDKIRYDDQGVYKQSPNIQIIGNAIAKGYSVDVIAELLLHNNISNFMVDIGGEIRVHGVNSKGTDWVIGINTPYEDSKYTDYSVSVSLHNMSIATSGNYRKFYVENEQRISHTIDPRTGYPTNNTLLSASVITDLCIDADALATACMVMGIEKSIAFFETYTQYNAILMYEHNDSLQVYITPGIAERVQK